MASGPITSWQTDGEKVETMTDFIFSGSKISADSDDSHEIQRRLLLGRKNMTKLDSIFKSSDITLPTRVHIVKVTVFPSVMYGFESWTILEGWVLENWCFWIVVLEKILERRQTARRSNQSILKEFNPEFNPEDCCWSWSSNILATWCEELTHWKRPWYWEWLKVGREGVTDDEMFGWPHWLNGHEFGQTLGVSGGEQSVACCSPRGPKVSDTTEQLNNNSKVRTKSKVGMKKKKLSLFFKNFPKTF